MASTSKKWRDRYFWEKPRARNLWFRMSVPKQYQALEGKQIIQRDLGATDRTAAAIEAGRLRAELFGKWRRLSEHDRDAGQHSIGRVPTVSDLRRVATDRVHLSMSQDFENFTAGFHRGEEDYGLRKLSVDKALSDLMNADFPIAKTLAK